MSDFKKFCIDEKLSPVQIVGARKAWQEQQAIIDNLKAQLNNMETCYIEKKKECEGLQGRIDAPKSPQPKLHKTDIGDCLHFSTTMFHDGKATCFDCDAVVNHKREVIGVMQTRSLRGANDLLTDARQKAEDQINNGARLTKHQIDL